MKGFGGIPDTWEFVPGGIVWRILPADGRLIVGEERDAAKKSASLFCVGLDDGAVRWKGLKLAEEWWTGIETVHRGVIVAHQYPDPGMPGHRNIIAIDAAGGNRLWENRDLAFAFASGDRIYGTREFFDRRAFYEADISTGAVIREVPADEAKALRDSAGAPWGMDVQLPLPSGSVADAVRAAFPPGAEIAPGETLMHQETEISNCYETRPAGAAGRSLREHIFALDARTGAVLGRDVVCDGLAFPAGTTFIRVEERVLYVRERSTLRSFNITRGGAR
jgi:hypothetical protein